MTTAYSGDGITFPDNSVQATAPKVGMVNRIINGDMRIDQRNAGASVTPANGVYTFITDRWAFSVNQTSKLTAQQSTTAPTGFTNSLLATSSSAYSLVATDTFVLTQKIEGFNCADFAWGTANAQPVKVSFKVRSSLTGTFGGAIRNSASNRFYPFTYTVSSANTFEDKTVTIDGDTTGTWLTNNGTGLELIFGLGVGSSYSGTAGAWTSSFKLSATGATSVVGTSGATFYVTGVQLEKGSTATDFEYVDYGRQLQMCQRYFWKIGGTASGEQIAMGLADASTQVSCITYFPVSMRATPTLGYNSASGFYVNDAAVQSTTTAISISNAGLLTTNITVTSSGLTTGRAVRFFIASTANYVSYSAEL